MIFPNASIVAPLVTIDEENKPGNDAPTPRDTVPTNSVARARAMASIRLRKKLSEVEDEIPLVHPGTPVPIFSLMTSAKTERNLRERYNLPNRPYLLGEGAAVPTLGEKTITFANDHGHDHKPEPPQPSGKWRCCKCQHGHEIFSFSQGEHPVSTLNCFCTHRSCSKCTLENGVIKQFVPMSEPEVVPLSEDHTKAIRFGVFCEACGLSWRAQEVQDKSQDKTMMKAALQRISAVPRRLTKRSAHPLERLRRSQSMQNLSLSPPRPDIPLSASKSVLNLRALSNEMEKEHGQQAELVSVKFAGITCSCGFVTDASSLCYQVVDPPRDFYRVAFVELMANKPKSAGFTTTPKDQARGHQTPVLTLKGRIRHANPLRSCPVTEEDRF